MQPQASLDTDVYLVSQWKFDLDPHEPWWRRWYFNWVFKPLIAFSFKRVRIPPITEVVVTGKSVTCSWYEVQGLFLDEDAADISCLTEHWSYKRLPFNRMLPPESAQYSGAVFPRAKNPRRRAKPVLDLVITPRYQVERAARALKKETDKLTEVLAPK